ncbi:unnamed protein product, partial [Closterium sp. NIES-53]
GADLQDAWVDQFTPGDAVEPVEVAADSSASRGAEPGCVESGGAAPGRAESGCWAWGRAAGAGGTASAGGSAAAGGSGAGGAAGAGTGGSASAGGAGATGLGGARTGGTGAAGPGGAPGAGATGGAGAGGAAGVGATGGTGAGAAVSAGGPAGAGGAAGVRADAGGTGVVPAGSGGSARPRPYFVPLLEQFQLVSPLPALSPYTGPTGGLAERREPESRPALPVRPACTSRCVPRSRPPAVPGTHQMALRPSTVSQRLPLPSPSASSLPALADPESDSLRAARPTVTRVLATVVTDPSFESTAASALVTELVDFAAHCRLDFATSLVAESASVCPPSVGGECALSTDVLEDRQEVFQCFAAALPHLVSTLLAPEGDPDAPDIPTPRSYAEAIEGTYVDEVPPPGPNIVSGMWIFRVKRPPGSPPVFKARYVARGFCQKQGVDYFQTFSSTPKMTTLQVMLYVAAQRDYELHSLDFSTAFLQGSLHEEIWLRRPLGFTGSFPAGTQWSLRRPVYGLRQAPRSSLYTLPPPVSASGQVAASSQVLAAASRSSPASAPCPCRPLAHETLLWHHRLCHPSLPRLRGMASRALVSGLPSPARVRGQGHECYFLLVIDDYSRYTTVFPLRNKGEVTEVLIDRIRGARRQLSQSFGSDLPLLRLHSDRGGEISSDLLRAFCLAEGIRQTFTLPASPQQNGIAERCIGMPFAVQYAAHQINLQPRVSLPETTPTLRWTGKVGDASAFRVCGSRAFVRDTTADKLSSRAVPCVFLGFHPDAPGWQFYHPTSRRALSSQDVTFDESVSYYHLAEPVEVVVDSGAARSAETGGAETGGAETGGAETGGAESGGALGVPSRREPLSPQRLREWYSRRCRGAAGAGAGGGAGGATGATGGAGAAGGGAGAGAPGGAAGAGAAGGAPGATRAAGAAGGGAGAGATGGAAGDGAAGGAAGAGAGAAGGAAGAEGNGSVSAVSRGAARPRPYYVPLLQQSQWQPAPPLPGPSPYSSPTRGLTEHREPDSRPVSPASRSASPVRTVRAGRVSRPRLPPVPGTHSMTLRPSTTSRRVPLPSPPASSLPDGPDPESDSLRAASPTVTRFLATAITDPLFESSAASALVAELVDFAAACRLDYATSLVAVSASVCPPSVGGECALGTDVLEDRQEDL